MECSNKHCLWNAFGQCCHEDEEAFDKATPDRLDCPSSLRVDFNEQLVTLASECEELLYHRNMRELIEIKKFIESQREGK